MQSKIQSVVDGHRIMAVGSCVVPGKPGSPGEGNHLLITCAYPKRLATGNVLRLIALFRADAIRISELMKAHNELDGMKSLAITFVIEGADIDTTGYLYRCIIPQTSFTSSAEDIILSPLSDAVRHTSQVSEWSQVAAIEMNFQASDPK